MTVPKTELFAKWAGYNYIQMSRQPVENLENEQELVAKFQWEHLWILTFQAIWWLCPWHDPIN
jgi:hypothetical protein